MLPYHDGYVDSQPVTILCSYVPPTAPLHKESSAHKPKILSNCSFNGQVRARFHSCYVSPINPHLQSILRRHVKNYSIPSLPLISAVLSLTTVPQSRSPSYRTAYRTYSLPYSLPYSLTVPLPPVHVYRLQGTNPPPTHETARPHRNLTSIDSLPYP